MSITNARWELAQHEEFAWWSPEFFDKQNIEIKQKYSDIFTSIEQQINIQDDWNILDVGCGPTCISLLFTKGEKYGIDSLLDEYKTRLTLPTGIKLSVGIGENIKFKNNFFKIVVCRNALDHTKNPKRVIKEINRVLELGGYFIHAVNVCSPFVAKMHKYVERKNSKLKETAHPHFFTADEIGGLLSDRFTILDKKWITKINTESQNENKHFVANGFNLLTHLKFGQIYHKLTVYYFPSQFWKLVNWVNKRIYKNDWFEEEYFVVCQK